MFSWPKTSENNGVVIVTGRHRSPASEGLSSTAAFVVGLAATVGFAVALAHHNTGKWPDFSSGVDYFALLVVCGVTFIPGTFAGVIAYPFLRVALATRTTVTVAADVVWVAGTKYPRGNAGIQFTNLLPQSLSMVAAVGGNMATIGGIQETAELRMFYGAAAVLVARFKNPDKASRFALACNAAIQRASSPSVPIFAGISVTRLYKSGQVNESLPGQAPPALPPPGTVRRRLR